MENDSMLRIFFCFLARVVGGKCCRFQGSRELKNGTVFDNTCGHIV